LLTSPKTNTIIEKNDILKQAKINETIIAILTPAFNIPKIVPFLGTFLSYSFKNGINLIFTYSSTLLIIQKKV
jgi:hypothetical protein